MSSASVETRGVSALRDSVGVKEELYLIADGICVPTLAVRR